MPDRRMRGTVHQIRLDVCEVGRRLYQLGFVAANDGNISARLADGRVVCTPTGVSKGFITDDMLTVCDAEGRQVSGRMAISSEIAMHLQIYRQRSDVGAVVHAHPPTATGYAVSGLALTACVLPEVIVNLGRIPLAAYGTPGGDEIVEPILPLIRDHDAVLMANHGVVTVGRDPLDAHFKMETVEHFARIDLVARQLRTLDRAPTPSLSTDQVAALRERFAVQQPACDQGPPTTETAMTDLEQLIEAVSREVRRQLGRTE